MPRCTSCSSCSTPTGTVDEKPGAVDLPERGALEVDDVSFAYGGGPPDTAASCTRSARWCCATCRSRCEPGERVALVGPTGAGKSTLAKLMVRFYDPREGTVRFGGVDLRDATLREPARAHRRRARRRASCSPGRSATTSAIGRAEATDAEVDDAVAALGLTEIFGAFPDGLDTEVRERGSRLSAGEKQLVSLARAALADPAVLVLDEATSNLDPGTERRSSARSSR